MATLYQLLLQEQETTPMRRALAFLRDVGKSSRLRKVLLLVGILAVSSLIAQAVAVLVALIRDKSIREELKNLRIDLKNPLETKQRIDDFLQNVIQSQSWVCTAALIITVVLLYIKLYKESAVFEQGSDGVGNKSKSNSKEFFAKFTEEFDEELKELKKRMSDVLDAAKKAAKLEEGEDVIEALRRYVIEQEQRAERRRVIIGALVILIFVGLTVLICLKRKGVRAHTAIETLRSVGLSVKSPVIIGACVIGVLAIAAAVYFVYRRKRT